MNKYQLLIFIFLLPFCSLQKEWIIQETGISDGIHDIEMIDDHTGYAYSYGTGKLLKTKNGGQSWDQIAQFDSLYFEQIQFIDNDYGFICGENNTIMKTSDGGDTWIDCHIMQESDNNLIYGMYFINEQTGLVSVLKSENGNTSSKIYQTSNGGETWELINSLPYMVLNVEKVGIEIWGTGPGVILRNIDQKDQWTDVFIDSTRSIGQVRDIAMDQKGKILAVSFTGKVLIKEPDHEEWEIAEVTTNRLRSVTWYGKNKWLIAGDKNTDEDCTLFETTDNGQNWEKVKNEFPDIHRIYITRKYVWIAGKEGFIAKMRI